MVQEPSHPSTILASEYEEAREVLSKLSKVRDPRNLLLALGLAGGEILLLARCSDLGGFSSPSFSLALWSSLSLPPGRQSTKGGAR